MAGSETRPAREEIVAAQGQFALRQNRRQRRHPVQLPILCDEVGGPEMIADIMTGRGFEHRGGRGDRIGQVPGPVRVGGRSEEHTSELQSLMRISYAVFCLKKKKRIEIMNTSNINSRR